MTEQARILLGARIAEIRKQNGLSQRRLSALTGVHQVHLHRIEHGQINVTIETLAKIADALDCHIDLIRGKA